MIDKCFYCKKKIKDDKHRDKYFIKIEINTPSDAMTSRSEGFHPAIPVNTSHYYRCKKKCTVKVLKELERDDFTAFALEKIKAIDAKVRDLRFYIESILYQVESMQEYLQKEQMAHDKEQMLSYIKWRDQ